jgi:hypothetical protein
MSLLVNLSLDRSQMIRGEVDCKKDNLRVNSMLRLRQEVRCYKGRVGSVISNDL